MFAHEILKKVHIKIYFIKVQKKKVELVILKILNLYVVN